MDRLKSAVYFVWDNLGNMRSQDVTINDDEVASFTPPLFGGFLFITTNLDDPQAAMSGLIYYDCGSSLSISEITSAANLAVSTSDVSGTTGSNGDVTVAVQSGEVKVENRSGSNCKFRVTFL